MRNKFSSNTIHTLIVGLILAFLLGAALQYLDIGKKASDFVFIVFIFIAVFIHLHQQIKRSLGEKPLELEKPQGRITLEYGKFAKITAITGLFYAPLFICLTYFVIVLIIPKEKIHGNIINLFLFCGVFIVLGLPLYLHTRFSKVIVDKKRVRRLSFRKDVSMELKDIVEIKKTGDSFTLIDKSGSKLKVPRWMDGAHSFIKGLRLKIP